MPNVLQTLKRIPAVRSMLRKRGLQRYLSARGEGSHYGRFETFDQARAWLPKSPEFEFDEFTNEYANQRSYKVDSFDYPALFWLRAAFDEGAVSVYDIGGSVGNLYYAYGKYLKYPAALKWTVNELPVSVKIGRELAALRKAEPLEFVDTLDPASVAADVWIAAGAIEFVDSYRPADLLSAARTRPRHVLFNKLPLYAGDEFVSTQNIGRGSFVPHYVYNRQQFIAAIEGAGYRLVDSWWVPDRSFTVHGQPENSFDEYSGLYFVAQ